MPPPGCSLSSSFGAAWQQHRSQLHRLDMTHPAIDRHAKGAPIAIAVNAHQDIVPALPFGCGRDTEDRDKLR